MTENNIPVVLFAYARPDHIQQTLESLRANNVPLLYVFSDAPKTPDKAPLVAAVRDIIRAIDWCDVSVVEREENLGLGKSILTGVTDIFRTHDTLIVFEDDLICVPGMYDYLCAALNHYRDDPRVMSVTGWTHPRITPSDITDQPYLDGRAECWVWGTWARVWKGMDKDALTLMRECENQGIDVFKYGTDLPKMAKRELQANIWAVRFLYHHIRYGGLAVRPPHSMVEHIGFDDLATNSEGALEWQNPPLKPTPPIPTRWPDPVENRQCSILWQRAYGSRPTVWSRVRNKTRNTVQRIARTTKRGTPKGDGS